ncbi:gamma-glutamyltransferase [Pseudomonas asiatica]|uniref:gamma-glutamyltransferase n=1 Tax=Pseudomonas asiatica TaxID=2219225 RepID=UPI00383A91C1
MQATIVAPQPEAADAGALVLERGGNAIDAALTCALVQGVVDPQMASLGGFGHMQVYMPGKGIHEVLEFYARAPLKATADMWQSHLIGQSSDGFGFIIKDHLNEVGHQAVCTPGSVKGYAYAAERYGTFDWQDLFASAINYADKGFMVRPHVHWYWTKDQRGENLVNMLDKLRYSPSGHDIYFNADGSVKHQGQIVTNPDLARTLATLAVEGPEVFYTGSIARQIAEDMRKHGGLIDEQDLASYSVSLSAPLTRKYRGHQIATTQPPSSGMSMLQLLKMLEHFDISAYRHSSADHLQLLAEAMKRMTRDKDQYLGDPEDVNVPVEHLLSDAYAAEQAASIRAGERGQVLRLDSKDRDTTHISVVDKHGNCVALTHSLGSPSGVIPKGLGFMLNGTMSRFDPRPGRSGSIAPGKRRASSAAPTIVFKDDAPKLVIGAPGGSYIAPAVAQAIMNVVDFSMPVMEAIQAPRIVAVSNAIDVSNRIRPGVTDELTGRGYHVRRSTASYAFAALHGLEINGSQSRGAADPQRDGMSITVD